MTHPYLQDARHPRVLAHRGLMPAGSSHIAENSFAAVAEAQAAGAEFIESDCHLTRDGEVVLFHDEDLSRVAGDPRLVRDVTLAELEALMADRGGVISLRQAFEAFPLTRFNIDIKAEDAAAPAGMILADYAERALVSSFSDRRRLRALAVAAGKRPELLPATSPGSGRLARVLAAVASGSRPLIARALHGLDALQIPERQGPLPVLTRRLLAAAHAHGVEVHVWTINDPDDMRRLLARGVDGIVTDRADVALKLITRES
ncbi:glycerophosphodiester phosphodiesterase family protein [Microbacterium sp. NPDC089189]|uniref:glycerophosphodiester phosphodiesterase family protein n=1 Tax=Microbacterium sp. NPDC089189 TaxID=3154972 RepID=UPI00343FF186